jgi:hypothetical protein
MKDTSSHRSEQELSVQVVNDRPLEVSTDGVDGTEDTEQKKSFQRVLGTFQSLAIIPGLISLAFATNCGGGENIDYPDSLRAASAPMVLVCAGVILDGVRRVLKNT